jgi:hypothetical protein
MKPGPLIASVVQDSLAQQGLMMTGFVGLVTFVNAEGEQMYALSLGSDQTAVTTAGIKDIMGNMIDELVRRNFPVE